VAGTHSEFIRAALFSICAAHPPSEEAGTFNVVQKPYTSLKNIGFSKIWENFELDFDGL